MSPPRSRNIPSGVTRLPSGLSLGGVAVVSGIAAWSAVVTAAPLDPLSLRKYVDPLPIMRVMPRAGPHYYAIGMWPIRQKLHRQLPPTSVWGYGPTPATASYPGATIEAVRGVPIQVRWTNHLPARHLLEDAIDPTLHMAHVTSGVPTVPHLHGGEVGPPSDGHPEAWFTAGFTEKGPAWKREVFDYPNRQPAATLWYHDHALGFTRQNIYAGLLGFYLLRDPGHEPAGLPSGKYEVPILIQDHMLNQDGSLLYPHRGPNPEHPVWVPEAFGNTIVVNGKIWPYLAVEPRKYRFRFLNGSNARFYGLALEERGTGAAGPVFEQIGSDGGYLAAPVTLNDPRNSKSQRLLIAPGERADVVVDFGNVPAGTELILSNTAKAPFPSGEAPDPRTVGQVMMFRVGARAGVDRSHVPRRLRRIEPLRQPTVTRTLTIEEIEGPKGPLAGLLDGLMWDDPITELPTLGTSEVWQIANLTEDTHPIHLHLLQFRLLNRQRLDVQAYSAATRRGRPPRAMGHARTKAHRNPDPPSLGPFLIGRPTPPDSNEAGWKDTFRVNPGEVTRLWLRFAPQEGPPEFGFDATAEPGYMWHCHILEHGDNEMMRPLKLVAPRRPRHRPD